MQEGNQKEDEADAQQYGSRFVRTTMRNFGTLIAALLLLSLTGCRVSFNFWKEGLGFIVGAIICLWAWDVTKNLRK